jgi:hypothetical protein
MEQVLWGLTAQMHLRRARTCYVAASLRKTLFFPLCDGVQCRFGGKTPICNGSVAALQRNPKNQNTYSRVLATLEVRD